MNDVNEWSSEYGVKVESFSDLAESPHSWDKRVSGYYSCKEWKKLPIQTWFTNVSNEN